MPLVRDEILGDCYLDPEAFVQRAHVFGVGMSIQNATRDQLVALLASASRRVDEICGRSFAPEQIVETHRFNERTRRVSVNSPPVEELIGFAIILSNRQRATFRVEDVFVNKQENYCELLDFSLGSSLTTSLVSFGLRDAQAEVTYKTFQDPPAAVKRATGLIAAHQANAGFVNAIVPAQFGTLAVGGSKFSNVQVDEPAAVRDALGDYIRIPIG